MDDLGFIHRYEPAQREGLAPLLLLHGTGGDENGLMGLGARILPGAALLSPRGKVLEHGMPRYFRRLAEGVFDMQDLAVRTDELAAFVEKARDAYQLSKPVAVGFSNGANIAWSLLLRHPQILAGAALMRGILPTEPEHVADLSDVRVLILDGAHDPLVAPGRRERLRQVLAGAGADVMAHTLEAGHQLTPDDLTLTQAWLASLNA